MLDQWGITPGKVEREQMNRLLEDTAYIDSLDNALYDLTPNAMEDLNRRLIEYPDTWYFSYVTRSTIPFGRKALPVPYWTHFPHSYGVCHGYPRLSRRSDAPSCPAALACK